MNSTTSRDQFASRCLICLLAIGTNLATTISLGRAESMASVGLPAEKSVDAPNGLKVSVKMIGPATQTTDLQIICVLQHKPAPGGDAYKEAMADLNSKLGGIISSLRDRGEFAGEAGETILFTPPAGSITARKLLLIGVGEESTLTVDTLRLAGRVAARESVRLGVSQVSFAPALRDQGSTRIDVGEGDAAFVEQFILACDTERRLQDQALSPKANLTNLTIEAGPKYFSGALEKVSKAVTSAKMQIAKRNQAPYGAASEKLPSHGKSNGAN